MIKRIKQVVSALTASINDADRRFIAANLRSAEQTLFWRMSVPDQRHALNVAYTALSLAADQQVIDITVLTKAALLHDVGKEQGDISTVDKIITVLAVGLAPQWTRQWGVLGRGSKLDNLKHAFYIYFNHAQRSCKMLTAVQTNSKIAAIIARHHKTPAEDDPSELIILRKADDLN